MTPNRPTLRAIVEQVRREEQAPAIVVVAMVVVGLCLSLFGASLAGEIGLALIAGAGGLFAMLALGKDKKR